jgi:thiamine-phosphate pyrophosphorylase
MTRLIVISSEQDLPEEPAAVTALFREGMQLFHLRKPHWSGDQHAQFLSAVPDVFHGRISLHYHHDIAQQFGIRYLHLPEKERMAGTQPHRGYTSTSFHSVNDVVANTGFTYCFLSPVFDSISKQGHAGRFAGTRFSFPLPVFALGGITPANAGVAIDRGFSGIATLGYVWSDPAQAVRHFKNLDRICNASVPM